MLLPCPALVTANHRTWESNLEEEKKEPEKHSRWFNMHLLACSAMWVILFFLHWAPTKFRIQMCFSRALCTFVTRVIVRWKSGFPQNQRSPCNDFSSPVNFSFLSEINFQILHVLVRCQADYSNCEP